MSIVLAHLAGKPLDKVTKWIGDSVLYTINCTEILDTNELIVGSLDPKEIPGCILSNMRPRLGMSVEVRITNTSISNAASNTYTILIPFITTKGNQKTASFQLTVFK